MRQKILLGASLGHCVHIGGVQHFLDQAEQEGWQAVFLGPAVSVEEILEATRRYQPDVVALGYRLTPSNVLPLVRQLKAGAAALPQQPHWLFGGTRPVAEAVRALNFFDTVYDGTEDLDDTIAFLRGSIRDVSAHAPAQALAPRLAEKSPYPLLRHHFGLPSFDETLAGIEAIAASRALDVISLGIDQNTQQFFFHPDQRDAQMDGAGGVPVRTEQQFKQLKSAAQTGNLPLMRCYAGTADVVRFGEMLLDTIDNAWCATPLCWFNRLDGRGARTVSETMTDAQQLMRLHAARGKPVEVNEPHHWGLRDAHDTISVAMAYISAYNARAMGVHDYIAQYMFNIPGTMSFAMDLAKALAQAALVDSLARPGFRAIRQTRAGLPFLNGDASVAKGQLAASTMLQMAVKPEIIHVVGYSEAEHAATPEVVIESCRIVRGVIRSTLDGSAEMAQDPAVKARVNELIEEAQALIAHITRTYASWSDDPLTDPKVIEHAIMTGVLDAPHLKESADCRGALKTRMVGGRCVAWDRAANRELNEAERLHRLTTDIQREVIG